MSAQATVLYDAPGPRARVRNLLLSIVFAAALAAGLWWILNSLSAKGELASEKWTPFLDGEIWSNILLPGLWQTLKAAGLSLIIALPIGAVLALGRLSDHKWLRWPSSVIVEFFRAIPVLLLMVFAKALFTEAEVGTADSRPLLAVVTGLVLYNSSVLAEVFRSGILSLPKGQTEASLAVGLRKGQMMRMILLPQAFTVMLPAIVSQLVVIVKDTALGSQLTILYPELLASARNITALEGNVVATYVVIAIIFIVVNFALTSVASWLERKLRNRRGGRGAAAPVAIPAGLPGGALAGSTVIEEATDGHPDSR